MTQLLQQPNTQAWLQLLEVVLLAVLVVCALLGLGLLIAVSRQINQRATLSEKLQPLLDSGDLDAVIHESRSRLMMFPDDAMAHYFLGVALQRRGEYRQALTHLRRIPELHAGWDVGAMIEATERKLQAGEGGSELRVVQGVPNDAGVGSGRSDV